MPRFFIFVILVAAPLAVACSSTSNAPSTGQDASVQTGGAGMGGSMTNMGGSAGTGGTTATGGTSAVGSTGGVGSGGVLAFGGVKTGGVAASGGVIASGGFSATGGGSGQDAGSRDANGATGGAHSGGTSGSTGGSGGAGSGGSAGSAAMDASADAKDPAGSGEAGGEPGGCPKGMVRIVAKNQSFMMGFDASEAPGTVWACYLGKHQVSFTYDYCMDANLATQADFSTLMGFNPSTHKTTDTTLPVDSETWYDAVLYCDARSRRDGLTPAYSYTSAIGPGKTTKSIPGLAVDITKGGYRLPTNAEYEYAERAGTTGLYFFSPTAGADLNTLGGAVAWYTGNSGGASNPVGRKKPNPWGLYDIVGNLFEWEHDWEGPYVTTPEVDPVGPATGTGCGTFDLGVQKMAKGGSYKTDVQTHMRISYHFKWTPDSVAPELGFRCVSTVVP